MEHMASCERLATASAGMAEFDWAEHCLKQRRRITAKEPLEQYVWGSGAMCRVDGVRWLQVAAKGNVYLT